MLISGDQQGVLKIWTLDNNRLIFTRKLHQARIVDIKIDPTGKYIATCSTDGKVYMINTDAMNQAPVEVVSSSGFIFSIEFSNTGKTLFVASNNMSAITGYPVLGDDMAKLVCPNVSRNLTLSEWSYYMGEEIPFEKTCNK
jgi:WD40 repeat protein